MNVDHLFFTGINVLLAWSVYVVLMTGSLSFAQGTFMAIGCYTAGVLTVMVSGGALASGTPDQIRASSEVQRAYLGSGHHG